MEQQMLRRIRGWGLYACAWVPVAAAYGRLIGAERHASAWQAAISGVDYALPAALLGAIVWWISGRVRWPAPRPALFFLVHFLFATAYSLSWLLAIVLSIAAATGFAKAIDIVRVFVGWQLVTGFWTYAVIIAIAYAIRVARALREKE